LGALSALNILTVIFGKFVEQCQCENFAFTTDVTTHILQVYFLNPQPIATIENVKLQRLPGSG
jgi:hypothetical protein